MSLRESNLSSPDLLQPVLDSLDLNVAVIDAEGRILHTNRAWNTFRRSNLDERRKRQPRTSPPPEGSPDVGVNYLEVCEQAEGSDAIYARQAADGIRHVLQGELPVFRLEYPCHSDREKRWFLLTVQPLAFASGQPPGAVLSHANITERVLAEQHAYRLSAIVESTDDAVVGVDLDGRIISWNASAERIYGYRYGEVVGADASILAADESTEEYQRIVEQARLGTVVGHRTARHQTKEGTGFDASLTISPIRSAAGAIEGTSIIARDVSRHLQIQRDLRDSEQRFRGTFENAKVGLALLDASSRWKRVNPKVREMLQRTEDELLGKPLSDVIHPDDRAAEQKQFDRLKAGEIESYSLENRFLQPNQDLLFADMTVAAQRGSDPRDPEFYIAIIEDVSDRAATAARVRRAEEAAKRLKSDFLANVSHEFRTPMNSILGMTRLALDELLPDHVRDYLQTAEESAEILLHLLDDILDFSKLESGRFTLDETGFDLPGAVEECVRQFEPEAEQKGIELRCRIDSDCPSHVIGDPFRLRQVLVNLISNAIKFTHQGHVEVAVDFQNRHPAEDAAREQTLHDVLFQVRDTGIGISHEKQQAIFEPFAQADTSTTRVFGGSGLGLAIATELISLMGGKLGLESKPGQGSRFWFTARFADSEMGSWTSDQLRETARKSLQGIRVVIADPDRTYARALQDALDDWYVDTERIARGPEVVSRLNPRTLEESPVSVALLDWRLPELDVLHFTRQLQEDSTSSVVPIVLVGGRGSNRIARRCRVEGVRVLRKHPLSLADLLVVLRESSQARRRSQRRQKVSAEESLYVLIAEDTPANQKLTQTLLERRGHRVALANNGREAVDLVQNQRFDAILMDVQMPTIDGLQATTLIRSLEDRERAGTPIIALTAHAMRGDAQRCLDAGMDAYLAKPLDAAQLIELVESLAAPQPPPKTTSAGEAPSRPTLPTAEPVEKDRQAKRRLAHRKPPQGPLQATASEKVMDLDAALQRFANNQRLLEQMITFFQEDAPTLLRKIRAGVDERSAENTKRASHSLKGLALNFDGEKTANFARAVESAAREGNWNSVQQQLSLLEQSLGELLVHLEQAMLSRQDESQVTSDGP